MKHLSLLSALSFTLLLAACGGGSITPPPPAGGFSNASLVGQYAFSLSGEDSTGAYVARVGSFAADGKGSITAGIEDFVEGNSAPTQVTFTGGTYTIQPNGRGTLAITASTGNGLQLSLTLISASQGILVETDLIDASSGHFALQTPNDFSSNLLEGNFVVDLSGISFAGVAVTPLSVIGQITLNGTGNVTGGVLDENDGTPSGPTVPQTGSSAS